MQLGKKAFDFSKKILKHYPISKPEDQKTSEESPENTNQSLSPMIPMHDHRKVPISERKEREIYERPTAEKIENMRYFKDMGNKSYRSKQYNEASYYYHKVIIYSDYTFPEEQQQTNEFQLILQQANLNLAMSLMKLKKYKDVEMYLKQAQKVDQKGKDLQTLEKHESTKKKSFYWQVKLAIEQGLYDKGQQLIDQLSQTTRDKEMIVQLEEQLKQQVMLCDSQKIKEENQRKGLSKKMFS